MLHEASSDGAVEMVRFLATECGNIDLEAKDKVNRPCVACQACFCVKHPPSGGGI